PFVDWERKEEEADAARAAAALQAERESREAEKALSRKAVDLRRKERAPLRAAKREVDGAENAVHDADQKMADLAAALASPELYEGTPEEAAREAARPGVALKDARLAPEEAMERWTQALEEMEELAGGDSV
ncbi:MAG: hypothetical protein ACWGSQ_12065, partial [Longimicrobiales bacterium]